MYCTLSPLSSTTNSSSANATVPWGLSFGRMLNTRLFRRSFITPPLFEATRVKTMSCVNYKWNEWCFRPRFWKLWRDMLRRWILSWIMPLSQDRSFDQFQQSSMLQLCYRCPQRLIEHKLIYWTNRYDGYLWITSGARKELFSTVREFSTFFDSIQERRFWFYLDGTYQYSKLCFIFYF